MFALRQGKSVVVIGGGDTGTDCIGTSVRHGAKQARVPVKGLGYIAKLGFQSPALLSPNADVLP